MTSLPSRICSTPRSPLKYRNHGTRFSFAGTVRASITQGTTVVCLPVADFALKIIVLETVISPLPAHQLPLSVPCAIKRDIKWETKTIVIHTQTFLRKKRKRRLNAFSQLKRPKPMESLP